MMEHVFKVGQVVRPRATCHSLPSGLFRVLRLLPSTAGGVPLYPSLAQDTMAGRPTELEATAGDVVRRAVRHGLPVPSLTACYRLLRGLERTGPQADTTSPSR